MSDLQTTIERFFALADALAYEERAQLLSEDVDFVSPMGAFSGRQATIDVSTSMGVACPTQVHIIDKLVVSGDHGLVEGRWRGTNTGPLSMPGGTIAATGRSAEILWCGVFHATGELLDSVHIYFDQLSMMGQLGLLPEPEPAAS